MVSYFWITAKSGKHGRFSSCDVARLDVIVAGLTAARSGDKYERMRSNLRNFAADRDLQTLWEYYEANWGRCKHMWVAQFCSSMPHIRNYMNDRIESYLGKLKRELDDFFSMLECV